jgi:hypothetical protein
MIGGELCRRAKHIQSCKSFRGEEMEGRLKGDLNVIDHFPQSSAKSLSGSPT